MASQVAPIPGSKAVWLGTCISVDPSCLDMIHIHHCDRIIMPILELPSHSKTTGPRDPGILVLYFTVRVGPDLLQHYIMIRLDGIVQPD